MADTQRFPGDDGWLIQITSRVKRLEGLLREYREYLDAHGRTCICDLCKRTDAELIAEGPASEVKP